MEDPLTPREHLELGVSYELDGETELAEREYRQAAEDLPLAHHLLGNLYFSRMEYDKAEKAYKKAVKGMPRDARPRNNLAWLYYVREDNLEKARELAAEAVVLASPGRKAAYLDTLDKIDAAMEER
jgi:Flp pilus assembly protein TadD